MSAQYKDLLQVISQVSKKTDWRADVQIQSKISVHRTCRLLMIQVFLKQFYILCGSITSMRVAIISYFMESPADSVRFSVRFKTCDQNKKNTPHHVRSLAVFFWRVCISRPNHPNDANIFQLELGKYYRDGC